MAIIACLGWGSLVWNPQDLPIKGEWLPDGPLVPVEFLRKSSNGRITLVLDKSASLVQSLWAVVDLLDVRIAAKALQLREGISDRNLNRHIGVWTGGAEPDLVSGLNAWAQSKNIDAVIWTALPRKFDDLSEPATATQVIEYLQSLDGRARDDAEQYVRSTPKQVDTPYRRRIEAVLGWTPPVDFARRQH